MADYFSFIDESGVLDESKEKQPFFAVGLVRVLDTSRLTEQLTQRHYDFFSVQKEARRKVWSDLKTTPRILTSHELELLFASTSHHEYKFTNIHYGNLSRYLSLLDTAFSFPLHFCALVIDKTDPLFNSRIYQNYWEAYITYAKLLCSHNCSAPNKMCVIADYMNRPKDADIYFEQELNTLPMVVNTLRAHSETFMLLQICDLLLGSVLFQWKQKTGKVENSRRAAAKKEFVERLISKLVIPGNKRSGYPLAQSITCNNPFYFSVWPLRLSDTKSGDVQNTGLPA